MNPTPWVSKFSITHCYKLFYIASRGVTLDNKEMMARNQNAMKKGDQWSYNRKGHPIIHTLLQSSGNAASLGWNHWALLSESLHIRALIFGHTPPRESPWHHLEGGRKQCSFWVSSPITGRDGMVVGTDWRKARRGAYWVKIRGEKAEEWDRSNYFLGGCLNQ